MTPSTILFITGNKGKVLSLQSRLPQHITIEQMALDLPEIQSMDIEEISREKARAAFAVTHRPLIVHDSGFYITALKGFPGPYIKHVGDTIGAEGLLKLMEGVEDRRAHFESTISYADENGTVTTFVGDIEQGSLATVLDGRFMERAWGEPWKIYIPEGYNVPLAGIPPEEIVRREKEHDYGSPFAKFAEWIVGR